MNNLSLKAQIYNDRLLFSIPDKAIRDELKAKLTHGDIVMVTVKEIKKKGSLLEEI